MADRKLSKRFVTPKGIAVYPRLNDPDRRFNPVGEFSCRIRMDGKDPKVQAFMDDFRAYEEVAYKAMCEEQRKPKLRRVDSPLRPVEDDDGNQTGEWEIKAKMAAHVETKTGKSWDQRPMLFDARLQPLGADGPKIGGGTTLRMSVEAYPFFTAALGAGVSLRLKAVQVIDLVEYVPGGAPRSHGFDEEDGFVAEAAQVSTGSEFKDDSSDDEEDF